MKTLDLRHRIYNLLENPTRKSLASRIVDLLLISIILLSVVETVIASFKDFYPLWRTWFFWFDPFALAVFTVEYLLRFWVSPLRYPKNPLLRYVFSPIALLDLLAILPAYLPFWAIDLRFLRIVRILRLFKIIQLNRYTRALSIIGKVVSREKELLVSVLVLVLITLFCSGALMYFVEHETQPEVFSNMLSSFWWALVSITTVGYGDIFPVTPLGKVLGGLIILLGVMIFALPTAIVSSGLIQEAARSKSKNRCPHCGAEIEKSPEQD